MVGTAHTLLLIILITFLSGCKREQMDDCFTSTGEIQRASRTLAGFHSIDLDGRIDLVFDHEPASTVTVEAGKNLLDQVQTEVVDSVLYINNNNRCNWVRSFKDRITVSVPINEVRKLTLRGTGNVSSADTITRHLFHLEQWGAMGTSDLTVDVDLLFIGLHSGAGDVILKGRTSYQVELYAGVFGQIDASQMRARFININNSSVGDFHCWVDNGLNVQIHDVGNVYYRGDPYFINTDITGSGSLIKVD